MHMLNRETKRRHQVIQGAPSKLRDVLFGAALCLGLTANLTAQGGEFGPPTFYGAGGTYNLVSDFNNDGYPDIATLAAGSRSDGNFTVYLNQGNGSFKVGSTYTVGIAPDMAVAGDLNNDGKLDLVIANNSSNFFSVALGNGDGTFHRGLNIETPRFGATWVALGDFNGDGNLDAVVTGSSTTTDNLTVELGNGDGTFSKGLSYAGGQDPSGVITADVDRDGKLDLIVSDWSNQYSVLLGNGDGTFQQPVSRIYGDQPHVVTTADFNGDGIPDLVLAERYEITILLGNGNGTFRTGKQVRPGQPPNSVALADLNNDGSLDFVVGWDGNSVVVMLGGPNGTFGSPTSYSTGSGSVCPQVTVGDFTQDGLLDLAVACNHLGVGILMNTY